MLRFVTCANGIVLGALLALVGNKNAKPEASRSGAGVKNADVQNVVIYREPGRFAGWPANHGIWHWGDEIVVGFEAGFFHTRRPGEHEHSIDYGRNEEHLLARTTDGGANWTIEKPSGLRPPPNAKIAGVPAEPGGRPVEDFKGNIDFAKPGFAITFRMEDIHVGPSRFYYTLDRCKTWQGPFRLTNFGQKGIAARTDYLVDGPRELTVFLTAAKSNGKEGRVMCVRTNDGAQTWQFVSFVTPEPSGNDHAIMPSSVRISANTILTAVRYRNWIDLYRSDDNGKSWIYQNRPAPRIDNPPSLIHLLDGRLVLTYGRRTAPFGIRARTSSDEGKTWSDERILRSDGGCWDLGYTRSVQRTDGKVVTVYYFNQDCASERFLAASIWTP
jgi:hypothetical protein